MKYYFVATLLFALGWYNLYQSFDPLFDVLDFTSGLVLSWLSGTFIARGVFGKWALDD